MENLAKSSSEDTKKRLVISITRMTNHNGPGLRTLVLFKGCPMRCIWCSTPESQKADPEINLDRKKCTFCGKCVPVCPLQAIVMTEKDISIDRAICNNCGECVEVCYPQALTLLGQWMSVEEILYEVERDAILYKHSGGGVTFSGGEPLLHSDFNKDMFRACKEISESI